MSTWEIWMREALVVAEQASLSNDVPVGALVVANTDLSRPPHEVSVLGVGVNRREDQDLPDPTAHAEVVAIRQAAQRCGQWRLTEATLFVTLEPCVMCAGAIVSARLPRIVFGAWDSKAGACGSTRDVVRDSRLNHQVEVFGGVLETTVQRQLRDFFNARR